MIEIVNTNYMVEQELNNRRILFRMILLPVTIVDDLNRKGVTIVVLRFAVLDDICYTG